MSEPGDINCAIAPIATLWLIRLPRYNPTILNNHLSGQTKTLYDLVVKNRQSLHRFWVCRKCLSTRTSLTGPQ